MSGRWSVSGSSSDAEDTKEQLGDDSGDAAKEDANFDNTPVEEKRDDS